MIDGDSGLGSEAEVPSKGGEAGAVKSGFARRLARLLGREVEGTVGLDGDGGAGDGGLSEELDRVAPR
ncbi:MAG: hypothetical protein QF724_02765, partial [Planctomycetota bacterium]|nr:hypothetical protein [Planctomycetota bacterium]